LRSDGQPPVCSGCTKRTDCKSSVFEEPIVALTLCNVVGKRLFHGDKEMTNDRIRKAVAMASDNLGFSMITGECIV
jgi:predicted metal-binding protein